MKPRRTLPVLDAPIDLLDIGEAVERISRWSAERVSRVVCICDARSVVTASRDSRFRKVIERAEMATPDGAPVAWMMRRQGALEQRRVSGPDLMLAYFDHAARTGESIYLYGSSEATLVALQQRLLARWPSLKIVGAESPPFRPVTAEEDAASVERINGSGAGSLWVSLGCPKQEMWMDRHRDSVQILMVGVGAAFDFHAGTVARAPMWMRQSGLEWLHRLAAEPRRLALRYVVTNTLFIVGAARQLLRL